MGPAGSPTPQVMVAVSTGVSRGDQVLLCLSRVPRSAGADLATVTANALQFVPPSWFYLTGFSQAPPASQLPLEPQSPIKTLPMLSMWASLSHCPAGISGPGSALPARPRADGSRNLAALSLCTEPGVGTSPIIIPSWNQFFSGKLNFSYFLSFCMCYR